MKKREKLFRWMCPEVASVLEQAESIVRTYKQAKDDLTVNGKDVRVEGKGIVFLGDVADSTIKVTPKLYTEVNLSKFELDALLHVSGDHQSISASSFEGHKGRVKKQNQKP